MDITKEREELMQQISPLLNDCILTRIKMQEVITNAPNYYGANAFRGLSQELENTIQRIAEILRN